MSEAWVGVIGTLAGALSGGLITAYVSYREQRRAPSLLLLEKRLQKYSETYGQLYSIAQCLHQRLPAAEFEKRIEGFRSGLISNLLYLDETVRGKVLAVHNFLMDSIDSGQLDSTRLIPLMNEANRALMQAFRSKSL
jgi:hypothetical protein